MDRLTESRENKLVMSQWSGDSESLRIYNRLAHYEDLIEQGLMIELPCKVGDVIYEANLKRNIVSKYSITRISTSVKGHYSINMDWVLLEGVYSNTLGFNADAIGKSVFLTREEAEEKLKEMENGSEL